MHLITFLDQFSKVFNRNISIEENIPDPYSSYKSGSSYFARIIMDGVQYHLKLDKSNDEKITLSFHIAAHHFFLKEEIDNIQIAEVLQYEIEYPSFHADYEEIRKKPDIYIAKHLITETWPPDAAARCMALNCFFHDYMESDVDNGEFLDFSWNMENSRGLSIGDTRWFTPPSVINQARSIAKNISFKSSSRDNNIFRSIRPLDFSGLSGHDTIKWKKWLKRTREINSWSNDEVSFALYPELPFELTLK